MADDELISTKAAPGPFDGFENAKPGEPIFTLQGGDPLGAPLVMFWANLARRRALGCLIDDDLFHRLQDALEPVPEAKREALLIRASEAEAIAWAMDDYREGEVARPSEERTSYSGAVPTDEARAALQESRARVAAHGKLHNSLAEASDVAELARSLGQAELADRIGAAALALKEAAEDILPARHQLRTRPAREEDSHG